ncbi:MAG: Gfo/Idh/MocA family protein [Gemmataceae bacterium]
MNRRQFLGAGAAGLALSQAADAAFADSKPPRVGMIGCGWYGKVDLIRLLQIAPDTEVVSLCDVDKKMLAEAADIIGGRQKSKKKPRTYADYRDMLKEKDLDIVLVATPDHWHALPMIAAVESGADVWVQKPISVDVAEGQAMVAAARKHNRVVQVGTQRRSTPHLIEARDRVIKEGRLGKIGLVEVYCYYHMRATENPPDTTPPSHLDYEMWTGPAPMRPYNKLVHPRRWRAFMRYGNGIMGDMCIHMLDMVRWMLNLNWPNRISSSGGIYVDKKSKADIPDTQTATFNFGDLPVIWQHRSWGEANDRDYPWGATLYGDKGTLKVSVFKYEFTPAGKDKPTQTGEALYEYDQYPEDKVEKDLERHVASAVRGHMRDFLRAIASRGRPVADIEQGHISTASCILANLSMQLGRSLTWDADKQQVVGDEEANKLLRRPYRKPWLHPQA